MEPRVITVVGTFSEEGGWSLAIEPYNCSPWETAAMLAQAAQLAEGDMEMCIALVAESSEDELED